MSIVPASTEQAPPAATPETQIEQYFQQREGQAPEPPATVAPTAAAPPATPAATTDPAAVPAATPDFWDELANDDDLPPSMKGKTRREVWGAMKPALAQGHQLGFTKNKLEADLIVERASNAALYRQLQTIQSATPHLQPHERAGIPDPSQGVTDPAAYGQNINQIVTYVDQQVANAVDHIRQTEVAPLRASFQKTQWDTARDTAVKSMKIEPSTWASIEKPVAAIMYAHGADPANPQNWEIATRMYREGAPLLIPQAQRIEAAPLAVGNARPAATAGPTAARKPATTGNRHMDAAIDEHLAVQNDFRKKAGLPVMKRDEFIEFISGDIAMMAAGKE